MDDTLFNYGLTKLLLTIKSFLTINHKGTGEMHSRFFTSFGYTESLFNGNTSIQETDSESMDNDPAYKKY